MCKRKVANGAGHTLKNSEKLVLNHDSLHIWISKYSTPKTTVDRTDIFTMKVNV